MRLKAPLLGIFCFLWLLSSAQAPEKKQVSPGMCIGLEPVGLNLGPINLGIANSLKQFNFPSIALYGHYHRGYWHRKTVYEIPPYSSGLIFGGILADVGEVHHFGILSSLLATGSKNITGVVLSGLGNDVKKTASGLSIAGIVNFAHRCNGASISGLFSQITQVNGFQASLVSTAGYISSIENYTPRHINGISINGLINLEQQKLNGVAITGLFSDIRNVNGISICGGIIGYNPDYSPRSYPIKLSALEEWYTKYEVHGEEVGDLPNPIFNGMGISSIIHTFRTNGFTFGLLRNTSQLKHNGVQAAMLFTSGYDINGLSLSGIVNRPYYMKGVSVSLANISKYISGLQLGGFNYTNSGTGIQLGIFNTVESQSNKTRVIQIGLLNYNSTRRYFKLTPMVNFTKKRSANLNTVY